MSVLWTVGDVGMGVAVVFIILVVFPFVEKWPVVWGWKRRRRGA